MLIVGKYIKIRKDFENEVVLVVGCGAIVDLSVRKRVRMSYAHFHVCAFHSRASFFVLGRREGTW